jgi:hypothetical protein
VVSGTRTLPIPVILRDYMAAERPAAAGAAPLFVVTHLTRAGRFSIGSALLVFLDLVKAVLTIVLTEGHHKPLLARRNRWGRWIFALVILANFAPAFF